MNDHSFTQDTLTTDSSSGVIPDTTKPTIDLPGVSSADSSMDKSDSTNHVSGKTPTSLPNPSPVKGTAMVYCPAKMIVGLPSIVNATLTKKELNRALQEYQKMLKEEINDASDKEIEKDIKSESIDLYETMAVKIEFDPDVFKASPKESLVRNSFGDKQMLEWEWEVSPLITTGRSFIHFKFYYINSLDESMREILDKRIRVDVKVDNRAFMDKWKTFILGDPKTTLTVIIIPLATFLGGFFTGKKNKKTP